MCCHNQQPALSNHRPGLEHKDDLANEYLGSFKVARFEEQDIESSGDEATPAPEPIIEQEDDPDYWRKLLGSTFEAEQACYSRSDALGTHSRCRPKRRC